GAHMIRAMRLASVFLLVLLCGSAAAHAQSPDPPAPRVTLDIALPPPTDHRLSAPGPPGRPAVRPPGRPSLGRRPLDPRRELELPAVARRHPAGQECAYRAAGLHARGHAEVS